MEIIDRDNGYVLLRVGPKREMYDAGQAGGRLLEEAARTGAVMLYCDYWLRTADGRRKDNPVNDYQPGSVREDFDFGAIVAVNEALMRKWEQETAEDNAGNTTRSSFRLVGKNLDIPEAVINELSIKGTAEQPDRIEILFLEDGNAAGMILADGLVEDANHILILPDIEVRAYDMIVVYWDREPESTETIITGESRAYIVSGGSDTTLSGTNGAVLLLSEKDGEIMDGLVYTTGESDLADGYGNNRTRNAALFMISCGEWEGEPVSSSLVTASRVIARLPGAPDSNSADDFFITEARKSSFGKPNGYFPYDGD